MTDDRQGILADVSITIANMRLPIHALNARETKDKQAVIQATLGVADVEQLTQVIRTLSKIDGVISVTRMSGGNNK